MSSYFKAFIGIAVLCTVIASPEPFLWARSHVFPPAGVVPLPRHHPTLTSRPSVIRPVRPHGRPVFPILGSHIHTPSGGSHIHSPSGSHIHYPSGSHIHNPSGSHIHTPSGSHIHTPSGSHIHPTSGFRGYY